jgi:hypothetical protein
MSAFVCGPDHFKALAIFAVSRRHGSRNVDPRDLKGCEKLELYNEINLASAYADILYAENMRSVLHRYPDDTEETAPGPIDKPEHIKVTGHDMCKPAYIRVSPVAILKMCDCLEYQSCETDDYRQTLAFDLLDRIRGAAIHCLPGYDDAPWDYDASSKRAA